MVQHNQKREKKFENILIKVIYQISFQSEHVKWFLNLEPMTLFLNDIEIAFDVRNPFSFLCGKEQGISFP